MENKLLVFCLIYIFNNKNQLRRNIIYFFRSCRLPTRRRLYNLKSRRSSLDHVRGCNETFTSNCINIYYISRDNTTHKIYRKT